MPDDDRATVTVRRADLLALLAGYDDVEDEAYRRVYSAAYDIPAHFSPTIQRDRVPPTITPDQPDDSPSHP